DRGITVFHFLIGIGAIHPRRVDHDIDVRKPAAQRARVGEIVAAKTQRLDSVDGAKPAGGMPAEESVTARDGYATCAWSHHWALRSFWKSGSAARSAFVSAKSSRLVLCEW